MVGSEIDILGRVTCTSKLEWTKNETIREQTDIKQNLKTALKKAAYMVWPTNE